MSLKEAVASVFSKYADFTGRARRSEYWYFCLFNMLVYLVISLLYYVVLAVGISARSSSAILGGMGLLTVLYGIYGLAVFIPGLAVCCRRLHDIGKAGSYFLFILIPLVGPIFLLIWFLQEGDHGANMYGPDPKGHAAVHTPAPVRHHEQRQPNYYEETPRYDPPPVQRQAEPRSSWVLEGKTGYYAGRRVPIRGSMMAGREPSCQIAYPGETKGVSHRHCRFKVEGSSLTVKDLGSSCGTFINGATRLGGNQSATLFPGDTVSLGSKNQTFTVRQ